ncbi:flagellar biosynthesis protein FlhG [Virgibacillus halotolerans]|uniref:MinD/ParA family protein n=1 Tax=Virgibacillus halotolerans TaxID=1071053 RepID=UPI001961D4AE|nr:MinD/ParA family protein [Virgibacillus halotolerans]MBM7598576.1 flagellar biosynthesis protein FlhG [Virgibacillus halotolerans]
MNDQAANLRRHFDKTAKSNRTKTISIISGKGGVGKSNIALNFSLELIKNDKKVLLFDLDVGMGNIDILLGLHAKRTIIDMFQEQISIHDIIETGPNGLSYIAGGSGLNHFFTMNSREQAYFFEQYYSLMKLYDYIIFDIGAGATADSLFFVLASNECIVVTTPEPTSITDAYGMIKHVLHEQPDMPIRVIMNRSISQMDGTKSLERLQQVVFRFLQIEIEMMGIIPDDANVSHAVRRQVPFVLLNDKTAVSKAMKQLTINYLSGANSGNKITPVSFVQRLKQLLTARGNG